MPAPISTVVNVPSRLSATGAGFLPNRHAVATAAPLPDPDALPRWPGPQEIDLGSPASFALLTQLDALWPKLPASTRATYLSDARFTVSVPPPDMSDILLLPGGVVALCRPEGILVPDPLSAVTFTMVETQRLQTALRGRQDAATLTHAPEGVRCQPGLPDRLEPQSATVVAEAGRMPKLKGRPGPVLVQWSLDCAVAWSFGPAPAVIMLAARSAGIRVVEGEIPVPAEAWSSAGAAERADLVAVGVAEQVNDLLAGLISDELRCEIIRRCVVGSDCLSARIADVLGALPAPFQPDASRWPGEPPPAWRNSGTILRECDTEFAVFGIDAIIEAHASLAMSRDALAGTGARLFLEAGFNPHSTAVALDSEPADFLVRRAGPRGRIGILVPSAGLGPVELYGIAQKIALGAGVNVTVAAPCWGFLHRVTGSGQEAGNAAWFGMGAGLDELDLIAAAAAAG